MSAPRMRLADDPDRPWVGPARPFRLRWTVTTWLIVVTSAMFVAQEFFPSVESLLVFTIADGFGRGQIWRVLSYALMHASTEHILFNMIALYFFGPIVEARLKGPRFLCFYCICAVGAVVCFWVLYRMNLLKIGPDARLLGASGAILGLAAAAAKIAPDRRMRLLFPPVSLRLVTMFWIFVAIAAFEIATAANNAGGEAAHLGGLVVGFILIRNPRWLLMRPDGRPAAARRFWKPGDPPEKFFRESP